MVTHLIIGKKGADLTGIKSLLVSEGKKFQTIRPYKKQNLTTEVIKMVDAKTGKIVNVKLLDLLNGVIAKNAVKCSKCKDVIESIYTNHMVSCSCGNCKIDGGSSKLIRKCIGRYKELAKFYI